MVEQVLVTNPIEIIGCHARNNVLAHFMHC